MNMHRKDHRVCEIPEVQRKVIKANKRKAMKGYMRQSSE